MRSNISFGILFLLCAVLFFVNTWGYDLWPSDEPRFGQVAREMMQSGDYLVPHVNGAPYKEKPPLLFWLICAASAPFGDVTEFSARVPSGLAALLTVLFTYLLSARLYGLRVGVWSAAILATTCFFWVEARWVRTDMLLTACMTGSLYVFWRWHESRRVSFLVAFYLLIAAGLLTKGPPALVFPLLLIFAFYWRRGGDRRELHWALGVAGALAVVLGWYIPARLAISGSDDAGVGGEAMRQIVGRLFLGVSHMQPPWYYVVDLPLLLLPWALFLPWSLPWLWKRRKEDEKMRLLVSWVAPAFIFFSLSLGKRGVYILPLFPVFAIWQARAVLALMDSESARWRTGTGYAWGILIALLGLAPVALLFTEHKAYWQPSLLVLTGGALICVVWLVVWGLRRGGKNLHVAIAGQFALVAVLSATVLMPVMNERQGASGMCRPLADLSERGVDFDLYTLGFSREEYIFYTRSFHEPMLTDLLPVKGSHEMDFLEMARQQRTLRKAIAKSVEEVAVVDLDDPTAHEVEVLKGAVHASVTEAKVDRELAGAFEESLRETVTGLARKFENEKPSFMFIQEEDWKWLVALYPHLADFDVVDLRPVGRRDMMLLANKSGKKELAELNQAAFFSAGSSAKNAVNSVL